MSLRRKLLSRRITDRSFISSCKSVNGLRVPECDFRNDVWMLKSISDDGNDTLGVHRTEVLNAEETTWSWSNMLPEILGEIVRRVEASGQNWPERRNVIACGCVCRQWREVTKEFVKLACGHCGSTSKITFPSCLKKPGNCDYPIQCLIKHDKRNAMFYLYLTLSSSSLEKGKFLLVARKYRNGANSEFIISLDADDFSQGSNAYVGKLRSDRIYDSQSQAAYYGGKSSSCRGGGSKGISPGGKIEIGEVAYKYKYNIIRSRGGMRRMVCAVRWHWPDELDGLKVVKGVLKKRRRPRWHEQLQCWCLKFHARVTVASLKNFQLVATMDQNQAADRDRDGDEQDQDQDQDDTVVMQFCKIGNDIFTMDFVHPLSAFQAFAICLTTFGTKLAL